MGGTKRLYWLIPRTTLILAVVQKNGAPVWLIRAAVCDKNVLEWLAEKGIKPPAVDSFVWS